MRDCFDALIKEISQEFSQASWKVSTVTIPKSLKPISNKDELKKQYWEVDKIRFDLSCLKSSVERRLSEIQSLKNNPAEIRKLLTTSSEGVMEAVVRGCVEHAFNPNAEEPVRWSIDSRIEKAKRKLERLHRSNKDLPSKFDAPIETLKELLKPLEIQLQWHEQSPLIDSAAALASTAWGFGNDFISKRFNRHSK